MQALVDDPDLSGLEADNPDKASSRGGRSPQQSEAETVLWTLLFRPHRGALLSSSASYWLLATLFLALLLAGAEGCVAFALALLGGSSHAVAAIAAVGVFAMMFIIDSTLVLLDVYTPRGTRWWIKGRTLAKAFGPRLAMFSFTYLVTLPVAQLSILGDELEAEHRAQWERDVDEAQKRRDQLLNSSVVELRKRHDELQRQWRAETDGIEAVGSSGLRGVGPRALKLERDVRQTEKEIEQRLAAVDAFSKHMASLNTLEARAQALSVPRPALTMAERFALLDEIAERPGVKEKSNIAHGYVTIIFGSILLLKLLAPQGVKTYLSEELQQSYRRARTGGYDHLSTFDADGVHPADLGAEDFRDWHETQRPELAGMYRAVRARGSAYVAVLRLREHLADASRYAQASFEAASAFRARASELKSELSVLTERLAELRVRYDYLTEQERSHRLDPELGAEAFAKTHHELTSARQSILQHLETTHRSVREREVELVSVERSLQESEAEWKRRVGHRDGLAKSLSDVEQQFATAIASVVSEDASAAEPSPPRWRTSGRSRRGSAGERPATAQAPGEDPRVGAVARDQDRDKNAPQPPGSQPRGDAKRPTSRA